MDGFINNLDLVDSIIRGCQGPVINKGLINGQISFMINKVCNRAEESDLSDDETRLLFMDLSMFISGKAEPVLQSDNKESNVIADDASKEDIKSVWSIESNKMKLTCQLVNLSIELNRLECDKKYDEEKYEVIKKLAKKIDSGEISEEKLKNLSFSSTEELMDIRDTEKLLRTWLEE